MTITRVVVCYTRFNNTVCSSPLYVFIKFGSLSPLLVNGDPVIRRAGRRPTIFIRFIVKPLLPPISGYKNLIAAPSKDIYTYTCIIYSQAQLQIKIYCTDWFEIFRELALYIYIGTTRKDFSKFPFYRIETA